MEKYGLVISSYGNCILLFYVHESGALMKMSCKCEQHRRCMFTMNIINIRQIQANPTCRYRQVEKSIEEVWKTIYNCSKEGKS